MLNFDSTWSIGKISELIATTSIATPTGGAIPKIQTPMIQDLDETFTNPNNRYADNFFESNSFNINYMNHDARISLTMAKEL